MNRGVRLPSDAAGYAALLHSLFEQMRRATDDIAAQDRGGGAKAAVRIMTPPSLATHWLMPRLPAFLDEHPGLDIRVYAVNTADGNVDDFDIVIGYGNEARWQGRATPLLEETTQPYCAPVRLKGASSWTAQKLLAQPLIRSRGNAVSWEAWFRHQDLEAGALAINPIQIDPSYVAIKAAVKGVGVILESSLLTQEHVDAGRLVAPLPEGGAAPHVLLAASVAPQRAGADREGLSLADGASQPAGPIAPGSMNSVGAAGPTPFGAVITVPTLMDGCTGRGRNGVACGSGAVRAACAGGGDDAPGRTAPAQGQPAAWASSRAPEP